MGAFLDHSGLDQHADDLLHEEGIAFRAPEDEAPNIPREGLDLEERAHESAALVLRERPQPEFGRRLAGEQPGAGHQSPAGSLGIGARGEQDEEPSFRGQGQQAGEGLDGGLVRPVHVLACEHKRSRAGDRSEQSLQRVDVPSMPRLRIQPLNRPRLLGIERQREEVSEVGAHALRLVSEVHLEPRAEPSTIAGCIPLRHPEEGSDQVEQEVVGEASTVGERPPLGPDELGVPLPGPGPKLLQQAALSDPRLAHDERRPTAPRRRRVQKVEQATEVRVAPHHRALEPGDPAYAGRCCAPAEHLVDVYRLLPALYADRSEIPGLEVGSDEAVGRAGDEHGAGRGCGLDPRGDVHRVTDGCVLVAQVGPYVADDDGSGVDPDPHSKVDPVARRNLSGEVLQQVDHLQAGPYGPLRVVLVCDRCAEERKQPVAEEVSNRPLVAVHSLGHELESAVHDLGPLLGIQRLEDRRRSDHVGEKGGDGAPLRSWRGRAHLLGQRSWRVRVELRKALGRTRDRPIDRVPAVGAEAGVSGQGSPAAAAGRRPHEKDDCTFLVPRTPATRVPGPAGLGGGGRRDGRW